MMTGSPFQSLFNIGPQIAGSVLGAPYAQYRPNSANSPTANANQIGTVNAWITPDQAGKGNKAADYGKPVWYGLFDPTLTQPGDYLIGDKGTFFIASQIPPEPMQVVMCNAVVSVAQPQGMSSVGKQSSYGGDQRATETVMASGWPCSMLNGTKGKAGTTHLPDDTDMAWSIILLPAIPGVTIRNNSIITDAGGFRRFVSSAELTYLGWRLTAMEATT
jgi:hypothetical protein